MLHRPQLILEDFDSEAFRSKSRPSAPVKHRPSLDEKTSSSARPLTIPAIVVQPPSDPMPCSEASNDEVDETCLLPRSYTHRRHSFAPLSMLNLSDAVQLRKIGRRRLSGATDDSLGHLALHAASPVNPHLTKWLTHSWVFNQRKKAAFFRGILAGVAAAILIKVWMRFVWL